MFCLTYYYLLFILVYTGSFDFYANGGITVGKTFLVFKLILYVVMCHEILFLIQYMPDNIVK